MGSITTFIDNLLMGNGVIIAVATYVVAEIIKSTAPSVKRFIPLIGAVLGIVMALLIPNIFPNTDIVSMIVMGMALGWASTGVFETIKGFKGSDSL